MLLRSGGVAGLLTLLLVASPRALPPAPRGPREPVNVAALARAAEMAGLRPQVLARALKARQRVVANGLAIRPILTVIDYTLPSRQPRLWVLDLTRTRVLAHELVAHGRATGDDLARRFSNRPGSLQSSLGTFLTGAVYHGRHGPTLRLRGLDAGLNDRAAERGIVIHGAWYVSSAVAAKLGRLGRSEGCPALSQAAASRIIQLIRDGSVLYAYFAS